MRSRRHALRVDTFPFLAVLLCTMGSLILILLVVDRRARVVACARAIREARRLVEAKEDEAGARARERDQQRLQLQAFLEKELLQVKTQADSVKRRADLSTRDQDRLEAAWQQLLTRIEADSKSLARAESEIRQMQAAAAAKTRAAEEQHAQALRLAADLEKLQEGIVKLNAFRTQQAPTYSLVPYHGKHGDDRRPIYVECNRAGVVFYPQRVALEGFFITPMQIRTEIDRRVARLQQLHGNDPGKKPYVLVLVRPSGVEGYYRLQSALAGLTIDFGYEMIDEDWKLDFPDDDSQAKVQLPDGHRSASGASRIGSANGPGGDPDGLVVALQGPSGGQPGVAGGRPGGSRWAGGAAGEPSASAGGASVNGPRAPRSGASLGIPQASTARAAANGQTQNHAGGGGLPGQLGMAGGANRVGGAGVGGNGLAAKPSGAGPAAGTGLAGPAPAGFGIRPGPAAVPATGSPATGTAPTGPSTPGGGLAAPSGAIGSGGVPSKWPSGGPANGGNYSGARAAEPALSPLLASIQQQPSAASPGLNPGTGVQPPSNRVGANGGNSGSGQTHQDGFEESIASAPRPAGAQPGGGPAASGASLGPANLPGLSEAGGPGDGLGSRIPGMSSPRNPQLRGPEPKRPRLGSNRDWVITVECRPDAVVVMNSGQRFASADLEATRTTDNPLLSAVGQMIHRRQAGVRPGDLPYRPQLRFVVHPEGLRTYYLAYPALERLRLTMTRENLQEENSAGRR